MSAQPFLSDIQTIRKRAREHMERGAVTASYTLDRDPGDPVEDRQLPHRVAATVDPLRHG